MEGSFVKCLYLSLIHADDKNALGVNKKIFGQIKAMKKSGLEVFYIGAKYSGVYLFEDHNETMLQSNPFGKRYSTLVKRLIYYKKLLKFIDEKNVKLIYVRYPFSEPFFIRFLKECKKRSVKVLLEIPTYPYDEEFSAFKLFIDRVFRKYLHKYVDRVVAVSNHEEIFGIPTIRISNGIDIEEVKATSTSKKVHAINLIGVANVSFWHGYDRVITGLYEYYKTNPDRKVYFHIVGGGAELESLKKLTETLGLSEFVIFHGPKHGEELDSLFDEAHIAIGSLGSHRKGLCAAAPIKTREYCARGIPFVISYDDVDFPDDFPYMLKVPADESPVDIEQILQFYDRIKEKEFVKEMREYAEKNLSWEVKLKPVIDEINRLLDEKGNKS
jgi:glycosyltransferase involved in cell wall biosynthesis